ncbi:MAG: CopG family transcriptional regulator [Anaerolineae bacterium]|nr:CopG family transcriptional regulator [Anaerolineae bacterium]
MRTTLDIDPDVLMAIKLISKQEGRTAGEVISQLIRQHLTAKQELTYRNGIPQLPSRSKQRKLVTMELVNKLRDELP